MEIKNVENSEYQLLINNIDRLISEKNKLKEEITFLSNREKTLKQVVTMLFPYFIKALGKETESHTKGICEMLAENYPDMVERLLVLVAQIENKEE